MSLDIPGEAEDDGIDEAGSRESMGWKGKESSKIVVFFHDKAVNATTDNVNAFLQPNV